MHLYYAKFVSTNESRAWFVRTNPIEVPWRRRRKKKINVALCQRPTSSGPLEKYWLPWKVQPLRALIFLEMGLLFSGFNVMFLKLQNGCISANKLNFEKLSPLSFLKLLKLEKIKCLYFCIFWLIFRDMVILWILPYYCSKSLFYSTFSHILTGEENFVKNMTLFLILKAYVWLGCRNIDFYDGSKIGTFDTHL